MPTLVLWKVNELLFFLILLLADSTEENILYELEESDIKPIAHNTFENPDYHPVSSNDPDYNPVSTNKYLDFEVSDNSLHDKNLEKCIPLPSPSSLDSSVVESVVFRSRRRLKRVDIQES